MKFKEGEFACGGNRGWTRAFNINPLFVGKIQGMSAGEKNRCWRKDLLKEQMCI